MRPILEFDDVSFSYHTINGEVPAIDHISFSVNEGEFIAIVGPSGCGKSTLMSLICGLISPESGTINVMGKPLGSSMKNIGYMLQKDHLFEWRTVYDNVKLGLEIHKQNPKESNINNMLEDYALKDFTHSKPSELSGGMRQRAALIRTLALEPDILLLDEPFSALDYQTRLEVGDDISNIIRRENKTAILVTHDISEAISLSERILVFTTRPASIKADIPIKFPAECKSTLDKRNSAEFQLYFKTIWGELTDEAK